MDKKLEIKELQLMNSAKNSKTFYENGLDYIQKKEKELAERETKLIGLEDKLDIIQSRHKKYIDALKRLSQDMAFVANKEGTIDD